MSLRIRLWLYPTENLVVLHIERTISIVTNVTEDQAVTIYIIQQKISWYGILNAQSALHCSTLSHVYYICLWIYSLQNFCLLTQYTPTGFCLLTHYTPTGFCLLTHPQDCQGTGMSQKYKSFGLGRVCVGNFFRA